MTATELTQIDQLKAEIFALNNQLIERDRQAQQKDRKLSEKEKTLSEKDAHIAYMEEQLAWFRRQIFGIRSERVVCDLNQEQLSLPGFETLQTVVEESERKIAGHTRKKPERNGQDKITLHPDLPVKTVIIDLLEEQKEGLVKIGEQTTHKLAHQPGSYYIKEIIRPKYAQKENESIITAELPESILPRCRADNSLLAEIITQKFADHLPLYRIVEIMSRSGVKISRKLLSQWVVRIGKALKPLYDEMVKRTLASQMVFIDETPIKLQDKKKCKQAYMWVIAAEDPPYRIYNFRTSRSHSHVNEILDGYRGHLHSDKYGAYERLAEKKLITWHPCWAHVRRKYFESQTDPTFRDWILEKIKKLFMLEEQAWSFGEEERLKIRQEQEIPIIDELITAVKQKLRDNTVLPKSKLREALGYFSGLIPYLKNYTTHSSAHMDNNKAERAIRPLAIGRKNWLFFGSPQGGEAGAVLFSLVQSCRSIEIDPREYLEDVFEKLLDHSANKLHELLPDQWKLKRTASTED